MANNRGRTLVFNNLSLLDQLVSYGSFHTPTSAVAGFSSYYAMIVGLLAVMENPYTIADLPALMMAVGMIKKASVTEAKELTNQPVQANYSLSVEVAMDLAMIGLLNLLDGNKYAGLMALFGAHMSCCAAVSQGGYRNAVNAAYEAGSKFYHGFCSMFSRGGAQVEERAAPQEQFRNR